MFEYLKTEPGSDPLIVEGYFAVSPARMFEAWTSPDIVKQWFGLKPNSLHAAEIDLRQGGRWRFVNSIDDEKSTMFEGEYLEIEPDRRLVFSWSHAVRFVNGEKDVTPPSRVEVEFEQMGSGTNVTLCHTAIQSEDARKGVGSGWETSFGILADMFGG
ncbi:MAG: SRPBCC family protein [Pseudomonadota bacterium]